MRKLAFVLCAALVGLGVSVVRTQPVLANGLANVPPIAVASSPSHLTVYEASTASAFHVFQKTWDPVGGWSGWGAVTQYGDTPFGMPANLTPVSPSATAAFTQLNNNRMWCGATGLPWQQATDQVFSADVRTATPAVLNEGNGFARVVGIDVFGHILTQRWRIAFNILGCDTSSLGGWTDTGGGSFWNPAIAGTGPSDYLMAVTGGDGNEWWSYNGSPWARTAAGGGPSGPALTTWGGGRYDIFVRGTDNALWHTSDPNAPNWESLGGGLQSGPGCASWAPNRIDCFVIGNDFAVWHIAWDGAIWGAWEDLFTA